MSIFNEFEKYLKENNYQIDKISDTSIRGIKGEMLNRFIAHLFYDYKYDEYNLHISDNGCKLWNSVFKPFENGYKLNHNDDKREFRNLLEIIDYTNSKIKRKI